MKYIQQHKQSLRNGSQKVLWQDFEKIKVDGKYKVKCNYCKKLLGGEIRNGTKHLHYHQDICIQNIVLTREKRGQKSFFLRLEVAKKSWFVELIMKKMPKGTLFFIILLLHFLHYKL